MVFIAFSVFCSNLIVDNQLFNWIYFF